MTAGSGDLFGGPKTSHVSLEAKMLEAERELGYRRRVYARLVANGRMTQRQADERILIMQAIHEDYLKLSRGHAIEPRNR